MTKRPFRQSIFVIIATSQHHASGAGAKKGKTKMKIEIDPVVYGWCRNHGLSVFDPDVEVEFGLWCEELDLNADVNGNDLTRGYDLEELIWRLDVELEDEILREEFYDSYAEFLDGPYVEWCEAVS